jgi:ribonuclease J
MAQPLKWIPLGGLGEVGKNMMAFEYGENILIVDTGIMFPESDMHGIDYVIPDFQYVRERADKVRGIVVTHGHEDHTGSVEYVVRDLPNVPIYATPLTKGLLEVKLREAKLMDKTTVTSVPTDGMVNIGPFKVEFFRMCHSIPDNVGLGITTPAGLIVHSGDFKLDQTPVDGKPSDFGKLAEFSKRGVLALMSDSTNAESPGFTASEREIEPALELVFRDAHGRVIIATFASLISRIQQVANVCELYGRKLAFAGTSMNENVKMAQKLGYLSFPEGMIVRLEEAMKMPQDQIAILATGSQGEPSAVLGRMAVGKHPLINVVAGDTIVLSAHPIPGNEESIHRIVNRLFQKGANVIYPPRARVHVSGHACQEEQKMLLNLVRPKYFIPIHGELRMLQAHARLARDVGVPSGNIFVVENGAPIEFRDGEAKQLERIPGGYVFVDGSKIGDVGPGVIRDREALSRDGFVVVAIRRATDGTLLDDPQIVTRGFVHIQSSADMLESLSDAVAGALKTIDANTSEERIKQIATETLARAISLETKRKPMIFAVVA